MKHKYNDSDRFSFYSCSINKQHATNFAILLISKYFSMQIYSNF